MTQSSQSSTQASLQQALPAGYRLGEYTLVRPLSAGGFSVVYLALDDQDQKFAIKEFLPVNIAKRGDNGEVVARHELDKDAFNLGLKCFFEEGRILAGIQHPNVVRVSNFFRANQTVYMVMEYAQGRPLTRELELAGGHLEERRIRKLFAALIGGLREVHLNRLLHLDLKPANIYVRRTGQPLLLDFGAARQTLMNEDKKFASMFTPGFAAPEQYVKDVPLGPWTDIYALGACMYVCLGARTPQPADARMQKDELVPARQAFARYFSPELLTLIDQCMVLDYEQRPPSLMALQKQLMTRYTPPPEPAEQQPIADNADSPMTTKLMSWIKNIGGGRS